MIRYRAAVPLVIGLLYLVACGGGGGNSPVPPTSTVVGGAPSTSPTTAPTGGTAPTPVPTPTVPPTAPATAVPTTAPTATAAPLADSTAAPRFLTDNPADTNFDIADFSLSPATGTAPIDGIPCTGAPPTLAQHIHSHLTLYVNGREFAIPAAIGIYRPVKLFGPAGTIVGWYNIPSDPVDPLACHYDVHVHAGDGVIHMETQSATQTFTLQQFLDIWGVHLSTQGFWKFSGPTRWFETDERVGPAGSYTVHEITGQDPATIQLTRHVEFTVEVGTPPVNLPNYTFVESEL